MRLALAAAFALALPAAALAKAVPPPPDRRVLNEGVIRGLEADSLRYELADIRERTGHDFFVALFQSLEGEDRAAYANRVFKAWGIGSKKADDGLLLCLFVRDRQYRVEVGYGLESRLTDLEAAAIVDAQLPLLKQGRHHEALRRIVEAFGRRLEAIPNPETPEQARWRRWRAAFREWGFVVFLLGVLSLSLAAALLLMAWSVWRRRREIWRDFKEHPPFSEGFNLGSGAGAGASSWPGGSSGGSSDDSSSGSSGSSSGSGGAGGSSGSEGGGGSSGGAGAGGSW